MLDKKKPTREIICVFQSCQAGLSMAPAHFMMIAGLQGTPKGHPQLRFQAARDSAKGRGLNRGAGRRFIEQRMAGVLEDA